MRIVIYGLTITSSWGNGHATTYRSLLKALARRGHSVHFIEKDVEWYRSNRDLPHPEFCSVQLYDDWVSSEAGLLGASAKADVIVVGSYFPDAMAATQALLERAHCPVLFYDIDTPITLVRLRDEGSTEYLKASSIPGFAAYLSFTGGPALRELEEQFGARRAVPFYCSVDTDLYHPTAERDEFRCDLSYLGTYASDRQSKLMRLLDGSAGLLPDRRFLVAGPQYPAAIDWQSNVKRIMHVSPPDHPSFYSSSRFTLNLTRQDMIAVGYSPSVRLFEASACGTAIVSDNWAGLEEFFTPEKEILLPGDTEELAGLLREMPDSERRQIGVSARARILAAHTSQHRAVEFEQIVAAC